MASGMRAGAGMRSRSGRANVQKYMRRGGAEAREGRGECGSVQESKIAVGRNLVQGCPGREGPRRLTAAKFQAPNCLRTIMPRSLARTADLIRKLLLNCLEGRSWG